MFDLVKLNLEYNRKAVIIEALCTGHLLAEVIRFFKYEVDRLRHCAKVYGRGEFR